MDPPDQEGTVKAIGHHKYGSPDVLELEDLDKPAVNDDGVLVRVRAASVNAFDWHIMRGLPYLVRPSEGLRKPKRIVAGVDMAGQVEAAGRDVTRVQAGGEGVGEGGGAFCASAQGEKEKVA